MKTRAGAVEAEAAEADQQAELEGAGFGFELPPDFVPRVTMSVEGFENGGKTGLALSASSLGLTAYMAFDPGWEIVDQFWKMGRKIALKRYTTRIPDGVDRGDYGAVAAAMAEPFEQWTSDLEKLLAIGVKVVILDTASEAYELCNLALEGVLNPNVTDDYGRARSRINATMRSIFRKIEDSGSHLIALHKLSPGFGDKPPRVIGWKDIVYYAPYIVRCDYGYRDPDLNASTAGDEKPAFYAQIIKSKVHKKLEGSRVQVSKETGFAKLCSMMVPSFPPPPEEAKPTAAPTLVKKKLGLGGRK